VTPEETLTLLSGRPNPFMVANTAKRWSGSSFTFPVGFWEALGVECALMTAANFSVSSKFMGRTVGVLGEVGSRERGVDMIVIWLRRCGQDGSVFMQPFAAGLIGENPKFANVHLSFLQSKGF